MESGIALRCWGKTSCGLFTNKGDEVVNVQDKFKEQEENDDDGNRDRNF